MQESKQAKYKKQASKKERMNREGKIASKLQERLQLYQNQESNQKMQKWSKFGFLGVASIMAKKELQKCSQVFGQKNKQTENKKASTLDSKKVINPYSCKNVGM